MAAAYANPVKLFGRWSFEDVTANDISVEDFVRACPRRRRASLLAMRAQRARARRAERLRARRRCRGRARTVRAQLPPDRRPLALRLSRALLRARASAARPLALAHAQIAVKQKDQVYLPHTGARYQIRRFRKAQCPIVERLVNSLMRKHRNNGKKFLGVRIVQQAFEIVHLLTDENPLQVYVRAVVNAGPREDSTRIGAGGIVRRQAVDCSPFRRVNQAIYNIGNGAREASFRTIKTIAECLADEIINASKGSSNSSAIKKKDEVERVAKANR